jgi:transposase-like protein
MRVQHDPKKIHAAIEAVVEKRERTSVVAKRHDVSATVVSGWIKKYQDMSPEDIAAAQAIKIDNRYIRIMRRLFETHMTPGAKSFSWERREIREIAKEMNFVEPSNFGDVIYSIRHGRIDLPTEIQDLAPKGKHWLLLPNGKGKYKFVLATFSIIEPQFRPAIKIPDATPQIVARHALGDEQAVLARVRYNRLVDIFLSVTSSALQSHLRATVEAFNKSQIETDELYVGVDVAGAQYIIPIQAKGIDENVGAVQAIQDIYCCREKFPALICRAVAAKTVEIEKGDDGNDIHTIALMELAIAGDYDVWVARQERYQLVPANKIGAKELEEYRKAAATRIPYLQKKASR